MSVIVFISYFCLVMFIANFILNIVNKNLPATLGWFCASLWVSNWLVK